MCANIAAAPNLPVHRIILIPKSFVKNMPQVEEIAITLSQVSCDGILPKYSKVKHKLAKYPKILKKAGFFAVSEDENRHERGHNFIESIV